MSLISVDTSESIALIPRTEPPKEMISIGERNGKTLVRINSSSHDIIQDCLTKAKYSLFEGWKSQNDSPALIFGKGFHKAFETFYLVYPEKRILPKLETMELMSYGHKVEGEDTDPLLQATKAFVKEIKPLELLPETDKRSIQNGVWLLWCYFKDHLEDPYVAYVDSEGPFIERKFSLVIHEDDKLIVETFGQIDIAFQHIHTKEIIPGDHKTTSTLTGYGDSGSYFDREKPNHQYTGYLLGARKCFNINTYDFVVNVVEVKMKPKKVGTRGPQFPRQITKRDENDFQEYIETVVYHAREYLEATRTGLWPMGSVTACNKFTGCQFRSVCSAPKELRPTILSNKFTKEIKCV